MLDLPLTARAQWILGLELLLLAALTLGIYAVKRRRRPWRACHCWGLTVALAGKTLLFLSGMTRSFWLWWPSVSQRDTLVMLSHALVGAVSLILGWWAVLALQFRVPLPRRLTVRDLKPVMRWTAITWVLGLVLGVVLYGLLYVYF